MYFCINSYFIISSSHLLEKKAHCTILICFSRTTRLLHQPIHTSTLFRHTKLLLDNVLQLLSSSGETRDTLTKLLDSHLVLVEVEAEERLVVEVLLLGEVEGLGV